MSIHLDGMLRKRVYQSGCSELLFTSRSLLASRDTGAPRSVIQCLLRVFAALSSTTRPCPCSSTFSPMSGTRPSRSRKETGKVAPAGRANYGRSARRPGATEQADSPV